MRVENGRKEKYKRIKKKEKWVQKTKVENGENHEYKRMKIIRKRVKKNESKKKKRQEQEYKRMKKKGEKSNTSLTFGKKRENSVQNKINIESKTKRQEWK